MKENTIDRSSGKLIRKSLLSMYPGAALYGLFFNIMLMIDSVIAGQTLGPAGIAAVAIGVPGYGILSAIIYALIHGSGLRMIWAKGSADQTGFRRAFNGGATLVALCGFVFAVLIFVFSKELVSLCGGDMVEASTRNYAVVYLRFCSPIVFMTALGIILQELMNVLGLQTARGALNVINVAVNVTVSVLCVWLLPTELKLAGLGIGTSVAGLVEFIVGLVLLRIHNVRLGYRPLLLRPGEIIETIRCGFPAMADYFAENIVMGIQNNLILAGFPGDAMILPTAEVVCNITYFACGALKGAAIAAEPLFGVFYAERDENSLRKVWKQGWVIGVVMSVVWAAAFYGALPALSAFCGMEVTPDIRRGVLLCLVFAPVVHTVYMFTLYYESTKRFNLSMAFAIIPDSCLYVLMMAVLIPILGKDGIWLAVTGNQVVGLILLIPLVLLISGKNRKGAERLLLLPREFSRGKVLLEFEIVDTDPNTRAELARLRGPLANILGDPGRTEDMMCCAEKLVADMRRISDHIHIKLREDGEETELFIRSIGQPWYLSESVLDDLTDWGDDATVSHSYVYKMNIVCVTFACSGLSNSP